MRRIAGVGSGMLWKEAMLCECAVGCVDLEGGRFSRRAVFEEGVRGRVGCSDVGGICL
jgi:hypothetical protein